jgi:transcriptional regulator with XRE-family HTH domain
MPAKPLSPAQTIEAARLKGRFRAWQESRKAAGLPWTQEEAAALLGFGQSALSQYLNGDIPLNLPAAVKFGKLLNCKPNDISPTAVREAHESLRRTRSMLTGSDE